MDEGRPRIDSDRDRQRFGYFVGRRALLERCVGVNGDTPIARTRDGDGKCDQFLKRGRPCLIDAQLHDRDVRGRIDVGLARSDYER